MHQTFAPFLYRSDLGARQLHDFHKAHPLEALAAEALEAAKADLAAMLADKPATFWAVRLIERDLRDRHGIARHATRRLLQEAPNSVLIENNMIWCKAEAAAAWPALRPRVYALTPPDRWATLAEIATAAGQDDVSTHAALHVLTDMKQLLVRWRDGKSYMRNRGRDFDYEGLATTLSETNKVAA